jgi:maltooligosyltrehalose synthase
MVQRSHQHLQLTARRARRDRAGSCVIGHHARLEVGGRQRSEVSTYMREALHRAHLVRQCRQVLVLVERQQLVNRVGIWIVGASSANQIAKRLCASASSAVARLAFLLRDPSCQRT